MKVQDNAMKVFVKECKSLSLEQVRFLFKPSCYFVHIQY